MRDVLEGLTAAAFVISYLGIPGYLLSRGWPLRAGIGMLFVAVLPFVWWHMIQGFESSIGDGVAVVILFPLPLLLIAIGTIAAAIRLFQRMRRPDAA